MSLVGNMDREVPRQKERYWAVDTQRSEPGGIKEGFPQEDIWVR